MFPKLRNNIVDPGKNITFHILQLLHKIFKKKKTGFFPGLDHFRKQGIFTFKNLVVCLQWDFRKWFLVQITAICENGVSREKLQKTGEFLQSCGCNHEPRKKYGKLDMVYYCPGKIKKTILGNFKAVGNEII